MQGLVRGLGLDKMGGYLGCQCCRARFVASVRPLLQICSGNGVLSVLVLSFVNSQIKRDIHAIDFSVGVRLRGE